MGFLEPSSFKKLVAAYLRAEYSSMKDAVPKCDSDITVTTADDSPHEWRVFFWSGGAEFKMHVTLEDLLGFLWENSFSKA